MALVKKLVCILVVGLFCCWSYYSAVESNARDKAVFIALDVSDTVRDFYKGSVDITKVSTLLTDNAKGIINTHLSDLKGKNDIGFNLTDYYNDNFTNKVSDDVADDVLDPVSDEALNYVVDETYLVDESIPVVTPNDSRIYTSNGKDFIKVTDLEFKNNLTYIDYNNITLLLSEEDMPLTYDNIVKNTDFKFILKDYSVNKREGCYNIGVEYISLTNKNNLILDLVVSDNKVKDIEIEVIESRVINE